MQSRKEEVIWPDHDWRLIPLDRHVRASVSFLHISWSLYDRSVVKTLQSSRSSPAFKSSTSSTCSSRWVRRHYLAGDWSWLCPCSVHLHSPQLIDSWAAIHWTHTICCQPPLDPARGGGTKEQRLFKQTVCFCLQCVCTDTFYGCETEKEVEKRGSIPSLCLGGDRCFFPPKCSNRCWGILSNCKSTM